MPPSRCADPRQLVRISPWSLRTQLGRAPYFFVRRCGFESRRPHFNTGPGGLPVSCALRSPGPVSRSHEDRPIGLCTPHYREDNHAYLSYAHADHDAGFQRSPSDGLGNIGGGLRESPRTHPVVVDRGVGLCSRPGSLLRCRKRENLARGVGGGNDARGQVLLL
jgi:hypothetical protein